MKKVFRRKGELIIMYLNGKHVATYGIGNQTFGGSREYLSDLKKEIKRRLKK